MLTKDFLPAKPWPKPFACEWTLTELPMSLDTSDAFRWDDAHFPEETNEAHGVISVLASTCWSPNLNLDRLQIFCLSLDSLLSNPKTQKKRKWESKGKLCAVSDVCQTLWPCPRHVGVPSTRMCIQSGTHCFNLPVVFFYFLFLFSILLPFVEKMLV